ncbi:unnamed protein product [Parnassius apollo]|uniref:(apollo) hypothetical protein n=1 Tax=Parnassius apollo TaxID=110799 RepID=A0A8S3WK09_PARAO|nr:unnamed protein product [Parnassius apollo]
MLVFCGIANPLLLWEKYRHLLSEDFLRAPRCTTGDNTEATDEHVLNSCFSSLQDIVISIGCSSLVDYGLPFPQHLDVQKRGNREYNSEINYDPRAMSTVVNDHACKFTSEQKQIFDTILESVGLGQDDDGIVSHELEQMRSILEESMLETRTMPLENRPRLPRIPLSKRNRAVVRALNPMLVTYLEASRDLCETDSVLFGAALAACRIIGAKLPVAGRATQKK